VAGWLVASALVLTLAAPGAGAADPYPARSDPQRALWAIRQAVRITEGIEDPFARVLALAKIGRAQARAGLTRQARDTFQQGLRTAWRTEGSWRASALFELAVAQAEAGFLEEAERTSARLPDSYLRASALAEVARAQAQAGWAERARRTFQQALQTARAAADVRGLAAVAGAQARAGLTEEARGTFQEAFRLAQTVQDASWRLSSLADLIWAQARAGFFHEALQAATRPDLTGECPPWWRARTLAGIAEAQARAGRLADARQTFQQALRAAEDAHASDRPTLLAYISRAEALAGLLDEAVQTSASLDARLRPLGAIAAAQARAGRFDEALRTAALVEPAFSRAIALAEIGRAQARAGLTRQAQHTFQQALNVAGGLGLATGRTVALQYLALAQGAAGFLERATQTARAVGTTRERGQALAFVVVALLEPDRADLLEPPF